MKENLWLDGVLVLVGDDIVNKNLSWTYNRQFEKNGFFIIRKLYDPSFLYSEVPNEDMKGKLLVYNNKLKSYYIEEELQVDGSISRHNFPKYLDINNNIKLVIESFIKRKLYKTYFYDRFYFVNQELKPHVDKEKCEISCSYHISSNLKKPWHLKLLTPYGEEKSIDLNPGDAIVYKGCEITHWRDSLPSRYNKFQKIFIKKDDTYYHQVFFHYVLQDGNYVQFAN